MANHAGQEPLPDSWEQKDEMMDQTNDITKGLGGLNVNAPVFVPSWLPPSDDKNGTKMEVENAAGDAVIKQKDEAEPPPPDDWAENGEGEEEEDEDDEEESEEMDSDSGSNGTSGEARPKVKRAARQKSESDKKKEHVNVVFIGHVDAGKSTIGGHLMYLTGMVDKRTLEKYEKEAKEKNRETWYLSWALDTNTEEREKGKTVEVGRSYFETENKHFTILDAPGHKSFVPNMIGGAAQADLAVLVISARKGEFETGFERGGQTREHAMLAKTAGVKHLIVLINKMDDPTVEWDEKRYIECRDKLIPFLKKCGFNPKTDLFFMPVSGLTGAFLRYCPGEDVCEWFRGPSFIDYIDALPGMNRSAEAPLRLPIIEKYKDMGIIALGKVESGKIIKSQNVLLMPNRQICEVMQLWSDDIDTDFALAGENVKVKLKNVEEEDVAPGFVVCEPNVPCTTGRIFDAQIVILEHKSIICPGYSAVMHIHTCADEVTLTTLICIVDKKTGQKSTTKPRFVKQDQIAIARFQVNAGLVCMETFKEFPQMGRFTLRDEGRTIAVGKVLKIKE